MDEQLLIRYLSKQCTEEDYKLINEWIQLDKANADWLFEIERIWSLKDELLFSDQEEIEHAFNDFMGMVEPAPAPEVEIQEEAPGPKSRPLVHWIRYAAVAAVLGLLVINIFFLTKDASPQFNTITVPRGQRVQLTLSDGTVVWLNADSRFVYPAQFSGNDRSVTLEGEGYFEVAHNKKMPFIVNSADLHVKVLGTKFNIRAYKHEQSGVVLKEGKVEVATENREHRVVLHPNEQVLYSPQSGLQLIKRADVKVAESWKEGELAFESEPLALIAKSLERRFDVIIRIQDSSLAQEQFTCRVKGNAQLEQVLQLLKSTRKLSYKINNGHVAIYKNK